MKKLVTFDQVLIAIKLGHHAARKGWNANSHFIIPSMEGNKCVGLLMSINGVLAACGLHPNDLLAEDWEIIEQPITAAQAVQAKPADHNAAGATGDK